MPRSPRLPERGDRRADGRAGALPDLLEAVEDQIEPELERAHSALRARQVELDVLVDVRVLVRGELAEEGLRDRRQIHLVQFEQAAAVPVAGLTALQGLRDKGQVRSGQKVLINGAGGGVGTFAVQIAKALGADVTAVTGTRSVDMVRSLGADRVVDRTREDFTRGGQRYDVIFDVSADRSFADYRRALAPEGTLVMAGAPHGGFLRILLRMLRARMLSRSVRPQKLVPYIAQHNKEDLVALTDLIEAGKLTPVVDRTYALGEAPAAIRHLAERRARGKIVITI